MLNVRLDEGSAERLSTYSQQKNTTKSNLVKEALAMYFTKEQLKNAPYELGKDLFGAAASGNTDGSTTYKSTLKQKLREKHTH